MNRDELESEYQEIKEQSRKDAEALGLNIKVSDLIRAINGIRDTLGWIALWMFILALHSCSK